MEILSINKGVDVIGDSHGCVNELKALLKQLDYKDEHGTFAPPSGRKAVFVGDLVDSGPHQKQVVDLVMNMVQAGHAQSIMGNHELDAIYFSLQKDDGSYVRPRTDKNIKRHQAFLDDFPLGAPDHQKAIEFFKSLPLFLDVQKDGVNNSLGCVHAYWCEATIKRLKPWLTDENALSKAAFESLRQ